jgi:hypothetical protein
MSGVIRSWQCLNSRCGNEFSSWDRNPSCPSCQCIRTQWIPGGGHVAGTAKAADAELRNLVDVFKMTDVNSATRGERAMPKLPAAPPNPGRNAPNMQFGPGFTSPIVTDRNGRPMATCLPSTTNVNFKAKVATNSALPHSRSVPGVHSNTVIESSHRPPR